MISLIVNILISPLSLFAIILYLLYYYGTNTYNFWKQLAVPYVEPKYPYLGTLSDIIFSLKSDAVKQEENYNYFKNHRFGGLFFFKKPLLFIRDPTLVEAVLIKDFTTFHNRDFVIIDKELEPLSQHLVTLEDQQWKSLRAKLSPTFTSGKLKGMHPQLVECADSLVKYINDFADKSEPIEVREVMAKFTTDVIGSCAFGLNTNALNEKNSKFREMGGKIFNPSFIKKLAFVLRIHYPEITKLLRWKSLPNDIEFFFMKMLRDSMCYREKNNLNRNDFLQLLMELKKQDIKKQQAGVHDKDELIIDEYVLASNALVFFFAGFETTASTLSYCLYELSIHEDIQEEAYKHVVSTLNKHGGEVTYEAVKEMTFLQNIFAETLRIHPPATEMRRVAKFDYKIPDSDITIPKGVTVSIPIYSLHHDPEYFPEPEKFKPERFDSENGNIRKGTYVPFGDGPRICIGKRFAEMEMQVALVKLLLKYKFKLNPKTISPLVYDPASFLLVPVGGIWIDVNKRN